MTSAYSITFRKLMTAGFISAETYRFVSPKERLYELSLSEIEKYKHQYKSELLPLFNDEKTYLTIAYMEKLESQLMAGDDTPYSLLIDCLCEFPVEIEHLVNDIGKSEFLHEYIYCTKDALKAKRFISDSNVKAVISFRNQFRYMFELYCSGLGIEECKSHIEKATSPGQAEPQPEDGVQSGKGFNTTDLVSIDDDAVALSNPDSKKYVLFLYSLDKDELDTVIEFLVSLLKTISIRTWNGIKTLGYREFLVNYLYAEPIKLLNLRNFGRKSLFELEAIRPNIVAFVQDLYLNGDTDTVEYTIKQEEEVRVFNKRTLKERIGLNQYTLVTDYLSKLLKAVSVRSRNGILAYKGDFIEDFVNKSNDIKSIKNIGKKSESEIAGIISKLKDYVATLKDREFSEEELVILEKQAYYGDFFDEYAHSFYSKNGHLPMFYLLEKYFKRRLAINRDIQIYNRRTPIFKDEESLTLEDIADERSLTRERVRQIHMKVRKHLVEVGNIGKDKKEGITIEKFLGNIDDWAYVIDELRSYNYIDMSMLPDYCTQESLHFTDEFVLYLISSVCKEHFAPIGKPILPYPTSSNNEWNNCYLIRKELADKFDFLKLFELIEEYEETNTESIEVSAREMVIDTFFSAWIDYDSNIVDEITDVVSNLLIQELGIIPDDQFRFTIEGKKEEDGADIIYSILKQNGNPLSREELYQAIDKIYPNRYKSPTSLNAIVMRDSRLCLLGGNNLVALIEWEHVKLGSIRNIIVQYLEQFDEPQSAKDIVEYVQQFRDTSGNSVRATMGSGDQFVQFSGGYYGLSWKQYPAMFYLSESDRAFLQRIQRLERFLQEKKHFPFFSSDPEEQYLHEWWTNVKSYTKPSEYQKTEIKRIDTTYKNLARKKKHLLWFDNCRKYSDFFQSEHRKPSLNSPNERELCLWFRKAAEDFSNGTLTQQQEWCYLELCKSL